ncbi:MAG: calcium-binding protein, partial [Alphaproteobacteria bacterium]
MVTISWTFENIDFQTGENVPDASPPVDPNFYDILVNDPSLMAHQYDLFDVGDGDSAVVRSRPPSEALGGEVVFPNYVYLWSIPLREFDDNVRWIDSEVRVGDGTKDTADDDGSNFYEPAPEIRTNQFIGLGGNDTARGAPDGSRLIGNTGDDSLIGGPGGDSIYGGRDNDIIVDTPGPTPVGGPPKNILSGDLGNDQITAAPGGANTLLGGPGNDFFAWGPASAGDSHTVEDALFGGADDDTVIADGLSGELTISGDRGADEIQVNGFFGDLRVHLGLGSDIVEIADRLDGTTEVTGDGGADRIEFLIQPGPITVDGGDDGDTIRAEPGSPTNGTSISVGGGEGGDLIETTGLIRNGTFRGEGGDDRIVVNPDGTLANAQFYGIV